MHPDAYHEDYYGLIESPFHEIQKMEAQEIAQRWSESWELSGYDWDSLNNKKAPPTADNSIPADLIRTLQDFWRADFKNGFALRSDSELEHEGVIFRDQSGKVRHVCHQNNVQAPPSYTDLFDMKEVQEREFATRFRIAKHFSWKQQLTAIRKTRSADSIKQKKRTLDEIGYPLFSGVTAFHKEVLQNEREHEIQIAALDAKVENASFSENLSSLKIAFADSLIGHFGQTNFTADSHIQFNDTIFLKSVSFSESKFSGLFQLSNCMVKMSVAFYKCAFESSFSLKRLHVIGDCFFNECQFEEGCSLSSGWFNRIGIKNSSVSRQLSLTSSVIFMSFNAHASSIRGPLNARSVVFNDVDFLGLEIFGPAMFSGSLFRGDIGLRFSNFHGNIDFTETQWLLTSRYVGALRGSELDGVCDMREMKPTVKDQPKPVENEPLVPRFLLFYLFSGAKADGPLLMDDVELRSSSEQLRMEIDRVINLPAKNAAVFENGGPPALRCVYENLKLQGINFGALVYFRHLLEWKRRLPPPKQASTLLSLYGKTSNYGMSVLLPLVTLAVLAVLMTSIYYLTIKFDSGGQIPTQFGVHSSIDRDLLNSLSISFKNVFRPFDVWRASGGYEIGEVAIFNEASVIRFVLRVACSIQSFLSLILIFLTALALRRRFQIGL